ncbi:hypothetical protein QVD17_34906 [Tagetes erecta]|uniref:Uncharacterized protein n=1 Tax=Tagetes erecta TaxID=13708 RepID=A0AAD8JYC9_TARER|nr:hypothetical protein QVD17_34906 [Tagetes erecta]
MHTTPFKHVIKHSIISKIRGGQSVWLSFQINSFQQWQPIHTQNYIYLSIRVDQAATTRISDHISLIHSIQYNSCICKSINTPTDVVSLLFCLYTSNSLCF